MMVYPLRRRTAPYVVPALAVLVSVLNVLTPWVRAQESKRNEAGAAPALSADERRRLAEADTLQEEALELWRSEPELALPRAEKAMAIRLDVLGERHPAYASSLDTVARLAKLLGDYPRAKTLYERALRIREQAHGKEHPDYLASLKSLAGLYYLLESYEQAKSLYAEASKVEKKLAILDDIGKPAGWIAVRSFAAIEQALDELSKRLDAAGGSESLPDLLRTKLGTLDGLDRARPIGVSFPVLGQTRLLGVVGSIPYTDRDRIVEAVTHIFPKFHEVDDVLVFQGGPFPAFGRLEEKDSVLLLSTVPQLLPSRHGRIPSGLFSTETGPSVIFHVDFEVEQSLRSSPLRNLEYRLLDEMQRFGARLSGGDSYREDLYREAFTEPTRRVIEAVLGDLTTADLRLWLQGGWKCNLDVSALPSSATAAFLSDQDPSRLRLPALSSRDHLGGLQVRLRLTDELRKQAERWLGSVRSWVETHPPPMEDSTAATHSARVQVAPKLLSICEQFFHENTMEAGLDASLSEGRTSFVFWLRGARCGADVLALSKLVDRAAAADSGVTPGFDRHGRTPIHLIDATEPTSEERVYVAAEDRFFLLCISPSPEHLKTILDLTREQGPLPPPAASRRALIDMDLSFANVSRSGLEDLAGDGSSMATAFRERVVDGPDVPVTAALSTTASGFTVAARLPERFLPALAAAIRAGLQSKANPE